MAKKKNTQKKHNFKHATSREAVPANQNFSATETAPPAKAAARPANISGPTLRDFSYVTGDLKRIGIAAIALVGLELVLFYVLTQTPAGASIYNLVKV